MLHMTVGVSLFPGREMWTQPVIHNPSTPVGASELLAAH
jgi:hypothetical protein